MSGDRSLANDALMGLRGVAALWVVGYHLRETVADMFPGVWLVPLSNGYLGVDLFFVLSGYSLTMSYAGRIDSLSAYGSFLRNRLARVYPLHVAILAALVGMALLATRLGIRLNHPEIYSTDYHLALNAVLLHAWGFEEHVSWNVPSWTISALFFVYLFFPLFDRAARRVPGPLGQTTAIVLALGVVVLGLHALGHASLHVPTEHTLLRASGEFFAGCLLYRLQDGRRLSGSLGPSLLAAAVMFFAFSPYADWAMAWGAALLVGLLASHDGPLPRLLSRPSLVWLGSISFSVYLVHSPLVGVLRKLVPAETRGGLGPAEALMVLLVFCVGTIAVAAAAHYLIEEPARRRLRVPRPPTVEFEGRGAC